MTDNQTLKMGQGQHAPRPKNWDDTFRLMSWWDSERVAQATVMVVGAGALGNEVLKNLALMGIGQILIIDFDTVEYSNLCRSVLFRASDVGSNRLKCEVAADRIREINPAVKVQTINGDILTDVGLGIFRRMDVVIGCLDNRLARLALNRASFLMGKTWVDGAIENLSGQLDVFKPGVSCYECQLSEAEIAVIEYQLSCADVARRNQSAGKVPTTPLSASIIAAMQVQEALKVVYKNDRQSMAGQHFDYEGMNNFTLLYPTSPLKEDCASQHFAQNDVVEAPELTIDSSLEAVLDWAATHFDDPDPRIHLGENHNLITELTTDKSNVTTEVLISKFHFTEQRQNQYAQIPGEGIKFTSVSTLDRQFKNLKTPLRALGIPPLHILKIEAAGLFHSVELTGDALFLNFQ